MEDRIEVSMGYTRNMGDFESMRIDVGLASDRLEGESATDAYKRVYNFVQKKMLEDFGVTEAELRQARSQEKRKSK